MENNYKALVNLKVTVFHELAHMLNINKILPYVNKEIPFVINENYDNISDMKYQFGFLLWGEYFAHYMQYEKFNNITPSTNYISRLQQVKKDITEGYIIINNKYEDLLKCHKMSTYILNDIYEIIYDIIDFLSYKQNNAEFNISKFIKDINSYLNVDIGKYLTGLSNYLQLILNQYPNNMNTKTIYDIAEEFFKFFDLLKIKIEFYKNEMFITYDESQPIISVIKGVT